MVKHWRQLRDAIGDEPGVVLTALSDLLDACSIRVAFRQTKAGATVAVVCDSPVAQPACAVAVLVDHGGCGRLKRCRRTGCPRVFVDWTNGNTRLSCRFHSSGRQGDRDADAPARTSP